MLHVRIGRRGAEVVAAAAIGEKGGRGGLRPCGVGARGFLKNCEGLLETTTYFPIFLFFTSK
jgi:hypothetical protein